MVSRMKGSWLFVVLVALAVGLVNEDVFARGGSRSSGSRSSFRSSRSSSASRSRSTAKPSKPSGSSWGKKSTKTAKPVSKADKAAYNKKMTAYNKAKASGKTFSTRADAMKDFKSKNAGKYTSKFSSQPSKRPDYIPQSTSVGGKTYNVTYNSSYGGYGYMGPSGAWIMYDAMADAAMMSVLMNRQGYYVGGPPAMATGSPVVVERHYGPGCWIGAAIFVVAVIFACWYLFGRDSNSGCY